MKIFEIYINENSNYKPTDNVWAAIVQSGNESNIAEFLNNYFNINDISERIHNSEEWMLNRDEQLINEFWDLKPSDAIQTAITTEDPSSGRWGQNWEGDDEDYPTLQQVQQYLKKKYGNDIQSMIRAVRTDKSDRYANLLNYAENIYWDYGTVKGGDYLDYAEPLLKNMTFSELASSLDL